MTMLADRFLVSKAGGGGGGGVPGLFVIASDTAPQAIQDAADLVVPSTSSDALLYPVCEVLENTAVAFFGEFELENNIDFWNNNIAVYGDPASGAVFTGEGELHLWGSNVKAYDLTIASALVLWGENGYIERVTGNLTLQHDNIHAKHITGDVSLTNGEGCSLEHIVGNVTDNSYQTKVSHLVGDYTQESFSQYLRLYDVRGKVHINGSNFHAEAIDGPVQIEGAWYGFLQAICEDFEPTYGIRSYDGCGLLTLDVQADGSVAHAVVIEDGYSITIKGYASAGGAADLDCVHITGASLHTNLSQLILGRSTGTFTTRSGVYIDTEAEDTVINGCTFWGDTEDWGSDYIVDNGIRTHLGENVIVPSAA